MYSKMEWIEKFKIPIALSVLGIVLILGGVFTSGLTKQKPKDLPAGRQDYPKKSLMQEGKTISVDVSGAVKKPGVYDLTEGARIEDAVSSAGGFSDTANKEYISKYLNMAQKLSDGSKVYVPVVGDSLPPAGGAAVAGVKASQLAAQVNINTGTQAELEALPGIGPVTASKIISDRPYQSVDELLGKKVVSKSVFEKIKDQIVVY